MSITFSLPQTIESQLRSQVDNLDQLAKEAAVVEFYRQGKLSHGELAESLGVSRDQASAVLQRHGIVEDLLSVEEFHGQAAALRKLGA